ncbi:helix-turn-helix transcriptional regulator [Galbibacter sp. BG1]|uniref:AraC family transcriptional regulator n=1 Tax=Galbibacter sp. BG1 TaxID=1170699 RepID=UPI0015BDF765|nr:AraC family transcriptional regulator [Galbibacter sp. BG1]QLE01892.1 helix-turn-helix transcriptional regulator [Galbibacter sp. BG1]
MKVLPFKIPKPAQEALVYQEDREVVFYDQLHQHEEIQISFILQGSGTLIVGDSINSYQTNDILVIGGNVPHVFKSDLESTNPSVMYTLFFTENSFGEDFFSIPDLKGLKPFFRNAEFGMKISKGNKAIIESFKELQHRNKIERIATLLKVMNEIMAAEQIPLSSFVYGKKYSDDEGKRMRAVFEHAMKCYNQQISLDDIAEKANMTKNAFCRYFKKRTNKTFFQFLIEIRIENACKLLYKNPELSIAEIAEICGFQNITNFNRKFKQLKAMTPSTYRSQYKD